MTQEEKEKLQQQQEALALFLVNNYEDIHKIEFVDITKGGFGVEDNVEVIINDTVQINTQLQDSYQVGNTLGSFNTGEKMPKQRKESINLVDLSDSNCTIYYFKGDE